MHLMFLLLVMPSNILAAEEFSVDLEFLNGTATTDQLMGASTTALSLQSTLTVTESTLSTSQPTQSIVTFLLTTTATSTQVAAENEAFAVRQEDAFINASPIISPTRRLVNMQPTPAARGPIIPEVEKANSIKVDQQAQQARQILSPPAKIEIPDPSSSVGDNPEPLPETTPNNGSDLRQLELPTDNDAGNKDQSSPSSNVGIVIGSLLGAALLIFGIVSYYRISVNRRSFRDSDGNMLDLRYSLEEPNHQSFVGHKHSSNNSINSTQDLMDNRENMEEIDLISSPSRHSFSGSPEDASEVLNIARSAQDAAQISGYFSRKYLAHDSVVSYDSFA